MILTATDWPVDHAMRPLVKAYASSAATMGLHLDDAGKKYARQGYLDPVELVKRLPWQEAWEIPLRESWEVSATAVLLRARKAEARVLKDVHRIQDEVPLTTQEEMALEYLEENGLTLIDDLTRKARKTILKVLDTSIREGWSIPRIVKAIKNNIGLEARQSDALQKRGDVLRDKGWKEERVERALEKYQVKLLRQRAENIARTETVKALNGGQLQYWKALETDRKLPSGVKRVWIPAMDERTCPICMELGAVSEKNPVPLGQPFNAPLLGKPITHPPAHPSCRCSMGLV